MNRRYNLKIIILISIFLLQFNALYSQDVWCSLGGIFSNQIGEENKYWNIGLGGNGAFFLPYKNNVLLGVKFSYTSYNLDEDQVLTDLRSNYPSNYIFSDIDGTFNIYGISPSIKIFIPQTYKNQYKLFGQVEWGYYFINGNGSYSYSNRNSNNLKNDDILIELNENKIGFNFGIGVTAKIKNNSYAEIFPSYQLIFSKEKTRKIFNINLNVFFMCFTRF
jgi:hypothetical protein